MGLLTKEVEVVVNSRNVKYYEDLGYDIPKRYDKNKKKAANAQWQSHFLMVNSHK